MAMHLMRPYDLVTFDCYGTLVDWETGIAEAFLAAARADGVRLEREAILAAYAAVEPEIEASGYHRYREVLARAALAAARRLGWSLVPERCGFLAHSLPGWLPFPDTDPALRELVARGYALGILSNVDDDLLALTCRHFSVRFDLLVTAQQVRSYKPAPAHFRAALERAGGRRWLHVAQSYFYDIAPALDLGVPAVWVNRKAEPLGGRRAPLAEVRDLGELVTWLDRQR